MGRPVPALLLVLFSILLPITTVAETTTKSPRFLVHLLDYLAKDYGGAVVDGKVISQFEYDEQVEFATSARATGKEAAELKDHTEINAGLARLHELILNKADADAVAQLARSLQAQVIATAKVEVAPTHWPNLLNGKELFAQNCTTCHGVTGHGDGPGGVGMDPKPADFHNQESMENLAPFQAYNTIRLGVPGTGMPPFAHLADKEVWDLAFYIVAMRHENPVAATVAQDPRNQNLIGDLAKHGITLAEIASKSDATLKASLPAEMQDHITRVRQYVPVQDEGNFLTLARNLLQDSLRSYEQNDNEEAKTLALRAYLEGIEPIEPRLRIADGKLVAEVETAMSAVRSNIEGKKPVNELTAAVTHANKVIADVEEALKGKELSPWVSFVAASAIMMREGFEAVLVIVALLGVIRASGVTRAALWVHGGWLAAVATGCIAWIFSGWLLAISGAQREMMEAVTSLTAVAVLLVVGFWLHSQSEIGRWRAFINGKVQRALDGKNLFGLAMISFIAVFREAFETVLFLRAIYLESGEGAKWALASGVLCSFILVILMAWAILQYSSRLPIRKLFTASAVIMAALALILTGKGFHSLQETGAVTATSSPINMRWDLIGFYPTLETIVPQLVVLGLVVALWVYGNRPSQVRTTAS